MLLLSEPRPNRVAAFLFVVFQTSGLPENRD